MYTVQPMAADLAQGIGISNDPNSLTQLCLAISFDPAVRVVASHVLDDFLRIFDQSQTFSETQ